MYRYEPQEVYWDGQHRMIHRLLESEACLIAADAQDDDHLYGCVVFTPAKAAVVHWIYVKGTYRRVRLAEALLTEAIGDKRPIICTQANELFDNRELVARHQLVFCSRLLLGIAPNLPELAAQGVHVDG
ncbi:MAG TPA: GNAT family N-acetyltransferase [Polyangiaceae bacterium]|nr:GNAT family N-acetyltransferase [Polyangiaceae bacterium]